MIYNSHQKVIVKNYLYNKKIECIKTIKKFKIPFINIRLIIEKIYKEKDYNENQIKTGVDAIKHFITSAKPTENNEYIVSDKENALRKITDFKEVLNDLQDHKLIRIQEFPEEKSTIKFTFKYPDGKTRSFKELHDLYDNYLTSHFNIQEQYKFDIFVKRDCIHEDEYLENRFKKIHILLALITIWSLILTLMGTIIFNIYQFKNPQEIKIKSISQDTLKVSIVDSIKTDKINNLPTPDENK